MDDPTEGSGAEVTEVVTTTTGDEAAPDWSDRTHESLVDEVKRLRDEQAKKRIRYAPYERAFDGMDPGSAEQLIQFASAVKNWDEPALKGMVGTWATQFGLSKAEAKEVIEEATDDGDKPLTQAALQKALADMQRQQNEQMSKAQRDAAQATKVAGIRKHAEGLGYDEAKDALMWDTLFTHSQRILRESKGSLSETEALDRAHEALDGLRTKHIDEWRSSKSQDAQRKAAPSAVGGTPAKDNTPTNLDDATANMIRRFTAKG